ncbi:GDSL-type esterase/lipase family protein [Streptomyces sp. NPDC035033]|uniref:GDSL-type esterase/lipase family protein n=1 Tax=Streptomyces sp. NPDC035033 TaxID=3155368 RepID=UPI0034019466
MPKLCILGASVAKSRKAAEGPIAGWGQYMAEFLAPGWEVRNFARDAMTARTYYTDRFATLLNLLEPGDIVALDFGGVEQRINVPLRYHGKREFKEFLTLYVAGIRAQGAIPVLLTPCSRCAFDVHGQVSDTRDGYPEVTREAAAETGAVFVDMNAHTGRLLQELGPARAKQYYRWVDAGEHPLHPDGMIDSTHFNHAGAREVARILAAALENHPDIPAGTVDPATLVPGEYPPPAPEFTVVSPESALYATDRVGTAPVFTSPAPDRAVSGLQKFAGTAGPDTGYLLFFAQGHYLGGTAVNEQGRFLWRRTVVWPAGEHTVQAVGIARAGGVTPIASLRFEVRDHVAPPVVTAPKSGAWVNPRPRFTGTAAPGVTKVMALEGERLIGEAAVAEDGTWSMRHPHSWRPGTHRVEFVSIFSALHSAATPVEIKVLGVPEDSFLRTSVAARERCGEKCDHYPFDGRW